MTHHIRRSQFIFKFGPGAFLEGRYGPRIIMEPGIGLFHEKSNLKPEEFEISDLRMSKGLLNGKRVFHLPSNAELKRDKSRYIYGTKAFPKWSLCPDHGILYRSYKKCPRCISDQKGEREAVRFVRVCPRGHLDDVDWYYVVHRGTECEGGDWFHFRGAGGSLKDINIECPDCGKSVNFGWAYNRPWMCSGRSPETEPFRSRPNRLGCDRSSRIIQRQSTNVHIPEIVSLFTIPKRCTKLHRLLQTQNIHIALAANTPSKKQALQKMLENLLERDFINKATVNEIMKHSWSELKVAIENVLAPVETSYPDLISEEFHALINASINGFPPVRGITPKSPVLFEVLLDDVKRFSCDRGNSFRIVPVSRLNTIVVQKGYRRLEGDLVSITYRDDSGDEWLPGVEFLGEGVFIMLDDNNGYHFALKKKAQRKWMRCYSQRDRVKYPPALFRNPADNEELHPGFVWWHTLSHLLIRVLAIDSGYSSASIRERVYFESEGGNFRGGVILYTTQPGGDGTLGGLVSLVATFDRILKRAVDLAGSCSNDPLCDEHEFRQEEYAGAACYGCLLTSETSCEHRNMWLDRHVFNENLP